MLVPRVQHFPHRRADIDQRDIAAGHGQCGVQDEVGEPEAHGLLLTEYALEDWLHSLKIEKRFVDVEIDQRKAAMLLDSYLS